jgi:hypothetical protein
MLVPTRGGDDFSTLGNSLHVIKTQGLDKGTIVFRKSI